VVEYERGIVLVAQVPSGDSLAILAGSETDMGELLYDLRVHRPALAELL
jgi:hypothetical protein